MLNMLEKIDSGFGKIESRQNGSSGFGSSPESSSLPAGVPHTAPRGQRPTTMGRVASDLGGGLTLNELGDSGFGAKKCI